MWIDIDIDFCRIYRRRNSPETREALTWTFAFMRTRPPEKLQRISKFRACLKATYEQFGADPNKNLKCGFIRRLLGLVGGNVVTSTTFYIFIVVCLSVNRNMQKLLNQFSWNLVYGPRRNPLTSTFFNIARWWDWRFFHIWMSQITTQRSCWKKNLVNRTCYTSKLAGICRFFKLGLTR